MDQNNILRIKYFPNSPSANMRNWLRIQKAQIDFMGISNNPKNKKIRNYNKISNRFSLVYLS